MKVEGAVEEGEGVVALLLHECEDRSEDGDVVVDVVGGGGDWWVRSMGLWSAVFNLSTTSIGAGIMALPATLKVLGLPLGFLTVLLMGLLTDVAVRIIVRFAIKTQTNSYGQLMGTQFGEAGRVLTELLVVLQAMGSLVVYLIITGDVLSGTADVGKAHHFGVLEMWAGGSFWWNQRPFVLCLITICVLYPLLSLREIDSLMPTSAISIVLAALFVLFTALVAILRIFFGQVEPPQMLPDLSYPNVIKLFTVIPVMTNAFICHYNVQPIYDELKHPSEARMTKASTYAQVLCTSVYALTAVFCFLLFGPSTSSDVLANYDSDLGYSQAVDDIVRIGYVIHLLLVFPIVHFPFRMAVDTLLFPSNTTPLVSSTWRFHLLTLGTMGCMLFLGLVIPDIYVVFSFLGALVSASIGFTLPALLALRGKDVVRLKEWEMGAVWAMLALGLIASATGISTDIFQLVQ